MQTSRLKGLKCIQLQTAGLSSRASVGLVDANALYKGRKECVYGNKKSLTLCFISDCTDSSSNGDLFFTLAYVHLPFVNDC